MGHAGYFRGSGGGVAGKMCEEGTERVAELWRLTRQGEVCCPGGFMIRLELLFWDWKNAGRSEAAFSGISTLGIVMLTSMQLVDILYISFMFSATW